MAFLNDQTVQQLADALKGNNRAQELLQLMNTAGAFRVVKSTNFG